MIPRPNTGTLARIRECLERSRTPLTVEQIANKTGATWDLVHQLCKQERKNGNMRNGPNAIGARNRAIKTWALDGDYAKRVVLTKAPDADKRIRHIVASQPAFVAAWSAA